MLPSLTYIYLAMWEKLNIQREKYTSRSHISIGILDYIFVVWPSNTKIEIEKNIFE